MKLRRVDEVIVRSEDGDELRLRYSNREEPYREGGEFELTLAPREDYQSPVCVWLNQFELARLREALNKLLGEHQPEMRELDFQERLRVFAAGWEHAEQFLLAAKHMGERAREDTRRIVIVEMDRVGVPTQLPQIPRQNFSPAAPMSSATEEFPGWTFETPFFRPGGEGCMADSAPHWVAWAVHHSGKHVCGQGETEEEAKVALRQHIREHQLRSTEA